MDTLPTNLLSQRQRKTGTFADVASVYLTGLQQCLAVKPRIADSEVSREPCSA